MNKKDFSLTEEKNQIDFLNRLLNQKIGELLSMEVKYRSLNTFVISGKKSNELLSAHLSAKQSIDFMQQEIRHIKALMLDIGNGNFKV